ncbi:methylthioribulose-1-phosphate dehydratase [Actinomadura pelletieri DSM 43383]|uniref:Methylthioribulose-1-phosphate dehydratase n=1 Tax=Actinomadura pelletieri DSM 43383 TaxID=1120940 RepID=A0A495QA86_9ACTN|nr:methylthioribulose 1-phosphate dehydratase [Actinomadura pelletieri]RKS68226.1 methylthioribulose-1-phosphate dehydratase [Actinomadura pelletieri DSM 43383]
MTGVVDVTGAGAELAEMSARFYARGWMVGTAGNLSIRPPGAAYLVITGSGLSKGELQAGDMAAVEVATGCAVLEGGARPSAETAIHAALYRLFADCGAVVHAHPPYATAVATLAADAAAVEFTDFEFIKGLGVADPTHVAVPVFPNWPQVARIAEDLVDRLASGSPMSVTPAFLIAHHGATTWGPDLATARNRMESLEALCHLQLIASEGGTR